MSQVQNLSSFSHPSSSHNALKSHFYLSVRGLFWSQLYQGCQAKSSVQKLECTAAYAYGCSSLMLGLGGSSQEFHVQALWLDQA